MRSSGWLMFFGIVVHICDTTSQQLFSSMASI